MKPVDSLAPLVEPGPPLTVEQVRRYSRHLIIPDVAMTGQRRLMAAKVLCVGAGGLGRGHCRQGFQPPAAGDWPQHRLLVLGG